jgi:hypothetical protein
MNEQTSNDKEVKAIALEIVGLLKNKDLSFHEISEAIREARAIIEGLPITFLG